jgi:hypothetical protein
VGAWCIYGVTRSCFHLSYNPIRSQNLVANCNLQFYFAISPIQPAFSLTLRCGAWQSCSSHQQRNPSSGCALALLVYVWARDNSNIKSNADGACGIYSPPTFSYYHVRRRWRPRVVFGPRVFITRHRGGNCENSLDYTIFSTIVILTCVFCIKIQVNHLQTKNKSFWPILTNNNLNKKYHFFLFSMRIKSKFVYAFKTWLLI